MTSIAIVTGIVINPMPVPIQPDVRSAGGASASPDRASGSGAATGSERCGGGATRAGGGNGSER
jgi:hypothetical protein